jgi:O-antigen ligase
MRTIERILNTKWYLLALAVLTLVVWTTKTEATVLPYLLGLLLLQLILFKDAMPTTAILLNALFMIGNGYDNWTMETIPLYVYLAPVVIILGMTIHTIRFKQKFFQGKLLPGILIMLAGMILSTTNAAFVNINYVFYGVVALFYAFVYFVYVGSFEGDHSEYLITLFFLLGLVIAAEVFVYYSRVEDVQEFLRTGTIHLGWGVSNYVATYLVMFIPATFYFIKKSKYGVFLVFVALFQIVALLFTSSKAGTISFLITLPMLIAFLLVDRKWQKTLFNFLFLAGAVALVYAPLRAFVDTMALRLWGEGLDPAGRIEIWVEGWEMFRRHPLFGGGIFARFDTAYRMYHNTFLHVAATMGILGLIGLFHQLWIQFTVLWKKLDRKALVFTIGLLGAHAHGMVDNIYLMPQFMIVIVIVVAVYESKNKLLPQVQKRVA